MSDETAPVGLHTSLAPSECHAFILAGGRSSRFGSDKALVEVDGKPLLLALRGALMRSGHPVSIVADRADRYKTLGQECLVDHLPDSGPLGGLVTALRQRECHGPGWLLLINCDQIVWRSQWFEQLAQCAAAQPGEQQYDAVYFASLEDPGAVRRINPLPSLLHTRLLPIALAHLTSNRLSLQQVLEASTARGVKVPSSPQAWSFNTPEELRSLLQRD